MFSRDVRHASDMTKHVLKILNAQRDLLSPKAIESIEGARLEVVAAIRSRADGKKLQQSIESLETAANKWLKPYPSAALRENVEVFLVALAVAMCIRTFFLQPFKIPTGSMQPTLYGIVSENLLRRPDFQIPTGWQRVQEWFTGVSYVHVKAENDGNLEAIEEPKRFLLFNLWQRIVIGGQAQMIWFPPDYGQYGLAQRAELDERWRHTFHKGDDVVKVKVVAGDHLFVDRVSYNFRRPARGEIIVFETRGIQGLPQDQFYIKRLVALPGERVQLGNDRHLIINGKRLDASTPGFEKVYSFAPFSPNARIPESQYSGHDKSERLAPQFYGDRIDPRTGSREKADGVTVGPDHYMVMGDNTTNSSDSRTWGDFPRGNVIGKSCFVYWPFSRRFVFRR
ncbi:MAG: signal peptidase I [Verrucomicrobia bacterium]|nr:signal peptidase I [Verrucomicrobiota bacterium]